MIRYREWMVLVCGLACLILPTIMALMTSMVSNMTAVQDTMASHVDLILHIRKLSETEYASNRMNIIIYSSTVAVILFIYISVILYFISSSLHNFFSFQSFMISVKKNYLILILTGALSIILIWVHLGYNDNGVRKEIFNGVLICAYTQPHESKCNAFDAAVGKYITSSVALNSVGEIEKATNISSKLPEKALRYYETVKFGAFFTTFTILFYTFILVCSLSYTKSAREYDKIKSQIDSIGLFLSFILFIQIGYYMISFEWTANIAKYYSASGYSYISTLNKATYYYRGMCASVSVLSVVMFSQLAIKLTASSADSVISSSTKQRDSAGDKRQETNSEALQHFLQLLAILLPAILPDYLADVLKATLGP